MSLGTYFALSLIAKLNSRVPRCYFFQINRLQASINTLNPGCNNNLVVRVIHKQHLNKIVIAGAEVVKNVEKEYEFQENNKLTFTR